MKNLGKTFLGTIGAATTALMLGACGVTDFSDSPPLTDQTEDYYTVVGVAQQKYDSDVGKVEYCPLDSLDRAVCAYGELTSQVRRDAQARGRQPLNVDPAGWPKNNKVTIPGLDNVEGSRDYHGWLWNRSHMLGDSLGGDPVGENLVTGTRTQNVGSVNNSGGMAYTETIARDYLDSQDADSCPLYYAATPNYSGDELIPRTVTVDIQSCDNSIDQEVEVDNTANGFTIDYFSGDYSTH